MGGGGGLAQGIFAPLATSYNRRPERKALVKKYGGIGPLTIFSLIANLYLIHREKKDQEKGKEEMDQAAKGEGEWLEQSKITAKMRGTLSKYYLYLSYQARNSGSRKCKMIYRGPGFLAVV